MKSSVLDGVCVFFFFSGDFRYDPFMLRESCLRTQTTIDVLYLDNTNCDPTRTLPTRKCATQQVKEIIRAHPGHRVVIGQNSFCIATVCCPYSEPIIGMCDLCSYLQRKVVDWYLSRCFHPKRHRLVVWDLGIELG